MHRVLNREELLAVYDEQQEKMSPRERQRHLDRRLEKQIPLRLQDVLRRPGDVGQRRDGALQHQDG